MGAAMNQPEIYLNRHWPNRLPIEKARELETHRLLAYYRKYRSKQHCFKAGYPEKFNHENDSAYNSEFDTNPNKQFAEYIQKIREILLSRQIQKNK